MKISLIAAMDRTNVIGKDGALPWSLPADLAHFKSITMGKPVLMGRTTHESIGRCLPGRRNIVLTRDTKYQSEGAEVYTLLEAALLKLQEDGVEELMVIGGQSIYEQLIDRAHYIELTRIETEVVGGDSYFPEFSSGLWMQTRRMRNLADKNNPYVYTFETWERVIDGITLPL